MAEKAVDVPDFVLFSGLHTGKFLEHVLETGKFSDLILKNIPYLWYKLTTEYPTVELSTLVRSPPSDD